MDVGFISDLHFGHYTIAKMRGFEDVDAYNEEIIKRWNSVCSKKTLIFLLGDVTMENKKYIPLLERLNGRKVLVSGNHDIRKHYEELSKYCESINGAIEYKGFVLTHIPIHPQEVLRYRGNIHGHLHDDTVKKLIYQPMSVKVLETKDIRYLNVSWDILEGIPISLEDLIKKNKGTLSSAGQ